MISRALTRRRTERRLLALLASSLLIAGTLVTTGAVLAVHDEGVFELEANAVAGNTGVGTGSDPANPQSQPVGGEDWDAVFGGTSTADATSFVTDTTLSGGLAGAGDSILSTNTKDIQLIGDWQWKQTTSTSVQDKADIEHAYAAQYVVDKTGDQCGTAAGTADCALLYFGADRFSNSGDTVMGFWFFKSNITPVGPDASGNGTFTGSHTARNGSSRGDILVVADFRAGGKAPQIQIYEWVTSGGSASTHLDQIGGGTNPASCTQAPPEKANGNPVPPVGANDNYCATANQYVVTSPWPFLAKDNSGGTTGDGGSDTKFGVAEFMEGGINMTALGLGDQCFSTFMAETRSSHSVTSTLSDFALGTFGSCGSTVTTTPQTGAGATLTTAAIPTNARVDVRDHAVIDVTGTDGPFAGTVKFYLCGPLALDTTTNCSTGGVQIGSPATGETVSGTAGAATVNSDTATLTSAGRYCWRANFSSTTNGVPASSDSSATECFEVLPLKPVLTTQAGSDVTLTNPITDTASLTGTAKQPGTGGLGGNETIAPGSINAAANTQADAGGTITFTVKGPDSCTASGLTVTGSPVTVSGDNASYGPVSATPTAIGKYTFVASYSGSSPNTLGAGPSSCPPGANDGDEEVNVTGVASLSTAQRWLPNDMAHITGPTGTTLSGSVTFTLYNDDSCGAGTGTSKYTVTRNVVSDAEAGGTANDRFVSTANTNVFVTVANDGTAWSWKVSYDDAVLTDPTDVCETTTPAFTLSD
ncbi:MAG TPA: hypothetical protein VFQ75_12150 [Candidatus Limnocylindrales bacterium]|nr:hypothetical protein [Candidatus Limnocylindrales bacterium]